MMIMMMMMKMIRLENSKQTALQVKPEREKNELLRKKKKVRVAVIINKCDES